MLLILINFDIQRFIYKKHFNCSLFGMCPNYRSISSTENIYSCQLEITLRVKYISFQVASLKISSNQGGHCIPKSGGVFWRIMNMDAKKNISVRTRIECKNR